MNSWNTSEDLTLALCISYYWEKNDNMTTNNYKLLLFLGLWDQAHLRAVKSKSKLHVQGLHPQHHNQCMYTDTQFWTKLPLERNSSSKGPNS